MSISWEEKRRCIFGRAIIGFTVISAVTLLFARCSPVAPSLSKYEYGPSKISPPQIIQTAPTLHVVTYSSQVIDINAKDSKTAEKQSANSHPLLKTVDLSKEQFLDFKDTGKVEIEVDTGIMPDIAQAVFRVAIPKREYVALLGASIGMSESLAKTMIDQYFALQMSSFKTSIEPKASSNIWVLSVEQTVDPEVSEIIRAHLDSITLLFSLKKAQEIQVE